MSEEENAKELYYSAHELHYKDHKLKEALEIYQRIRKEHPGTNSASDAKTQIHNIIRKVVPENDLIDSLVKMSVAHMDRKNG